MSMMPASRSLVDPRPVKRGPRPPTPIRSIPAGGTLFHEADPAAHLFEIVTGTLRLTRLLETGRRHVVAFAHPGDVVGFPHDGVHHCDCEALTPVTALVHRRSLLEEPGVNPDAHRFLQKAALREIACLQDHLLLMARKGACGKLASFLGALADRHGQCCDGQIILELDMPRADIADYLCMSVETVSRTLTRMRSLGLIQLDGPQRVIVRDRVGLADMAGAD